QSSLPTVPTASAPSSSPRFLGFLIASSTLLEKSSAGFIELTPDDSEATQDPLRRSRHRFRPSWYARSESRAPRKKRRHQGSEVHDDNRKRILVPWATRTKFSA